ncbi:hypothetical protein A3D68_01085 [Candidatus Adlerbacteria bacterium RIFCSPHIGHO2_02_FULL_52_17]|uniref:Ig-like domain-containing protein n=2 Tax=Patescibacteria group TaxID=1783273 RepID=A0A1F4XNU2_9BACT|nr:MAG: hypothetical protein A3D68_01085 [Candidatus Adlerbacteria bacterium RIFCSPHIGHO2_02_FULL_52_17]OGG18902.1 MAG: hypothetical protein A2721_03430 [Candidatus Gottesmanbacteria bacterium RIFCSPHIGHO2_01_FULL_47_48]
MIKKYIGTGLVALGLLFSVGLATPAHAASLTDAQISAIISLLQAFGADQSVINNVSVALGGTSSNSQSCSTFSDLSYGNFDTDPGGRVSQLQAWLGIPSNTFGFGTYGPKTRTLWNSRCDGTGQTILNATPTTPIPNNTPTCSIVANPNSVSFGQNVTLTWNSTNAVSASWQSDTSGKDNIAVPAGTPGTSGTALVTANVGGNPYITLRVYGTNGSTNTCKATFNVPDYPYPLNYSAPPTANIDSSSNSVSQAPVISGSASGAVLLMIELKNNLGNKVVSDNVSVATNGRWTWVPPIAIQNGVYVVNVWSTDGTILVSKTLTIGALANYDACRLDKLDGSNITRDAITDQYTCLAKICDIYGPANLPNNESKCVFNGTEIKRYTKPALDVATIQMGNTLAPQNAIIAFTKFTLTNSGTQQITVNGITVEKVGAIGNIVTTASDSVFANVMLRDENNTVLGSPTSLNSNHQANLGGTFTIMPGQTKTLVVYGTMAANNSADNGNVVGLSVTAISTTAIVNGSLPINGARDTVNTSIQCSNPAYGYECAN